VLVPDLAAWRRERLPSPTGPFLAVAPDWICEALSPSTARVDRVEKLRIYAREGVEHVWLLDPAARTLEVLARDGQQWRHLGTWADDERVRAPPFDVLELEIAALWAPRPPEAPR
jgi:Uma2 family endonuclease